MGNYNPNLFWIKKIEDRFFCMKHWQKWYEGLNVASTAFDSFYQKVEKRHCIEEAQSNTVLVNYFNGYINKTPHFK